MSLTLSDCITLHPVTSSNTPRYSRSRSGCSRPLLRAGSASLSADWRPYMHPEGQPYYVLFDKFDFAVVTEANMRELHTKGRILDCLQAANTELQLHDIKVPSRCELFLELGDDQASCNYYFVDHIGKCLFWLDDLTTESLDIPAVMSLSHIEAALERLYWVHVEYFPMHHECHEQDYSQIVVDLNNIITRGQADRLISRTSTFPYTANMCGHVMELLSRKKGQRVNGYTLHCAARLAGAITNQRLIRFYDEHAAQPDRCQEMFNPDSIQHKRFLTLANLLMWGIPQRYETLLEDLYVNEQVYADQWTQFLSRSLAEWTNALSCSFPILIVSILLANVRSGTVSTSIPPALSCAISIASASFLYLRYQPLAESRIDAQYLHSAKSSTIGFLPLATVLSLPRATYLWGVGLLAAQFLFVVFYSVNKVVALAVACSVTSILIYLLCVTHPEDASVLSLFRSFVVLFALNMYNSNARENEQMV